MVGVDLILIENWDFDHIGNGSHHEGREIRHPRLCMLQSKRRTGLISLCKLIKNAKHDITVTISESGEHHDIVTR
jgi:molybdenum cofactor biosynthesis enzyme